MKKIITYLTLIIFIISCSSKRNILDINYENIKWEFNNYNKDIVLGLSLNEWYNEEYKKTKRKIIVATLDSQIDLNHEDLKGRLWKNKKEIPNNEIDDDDNGYVDDINGWSFLGKPDGDYFRYGNFEYTKIVRQYQDYFTDKNEVSADSTFLYNEFKRAFELHSAYSNFYKNWLKSLEFSVKIWPVATDTLKHFFPKNDYNIFKLDSLYQIYKINDKSFKQRRDSNDRDLGALISYIKSNFGVENYTLNDLINSKNDKDSTLNRTLNIEFDPRKFIQDNPNVLKKGYGNNRVNNNTFQLAHNTAVSSIIAGNRKNKIGTKGFHDNIKIMPLHISTSGDEYDKDIAMAVYYAVDNGAKVINMSFGKEFSLEQQWVTEAFKYAEEHNVLLIHGSGNNNFDVDINPYYPSDYDYNKKVNLVENFINVGSISKRIDSTMVSPFSDYGKNNVDVFAPGEEIYVATPNNKYKYDSGTSLAAPMVSGTAALIWLYYPNLTAVEVKNIILESGVTIDKMVVKPGTENEMVHFSELSKTGKILNTYNAMKMAEEVNKKRK